MPKPTTITQEIIIETAFEMVRKARPAAHAPWPPRKSLRRSKTALAAPARGARRRFAPCASARACLAKSAKKPPPDRHAIIKNRNKKDTNIEIKKQICCGNY